MNSRAYIAEFVGTFALIFIGAGAGALDVGGLVGVSFAFGLVIVAFAYSYGRISGTHLNPAVTIAMLVNRKIEAINAGGYIIAQLLGAIVAGFFLRFLLSGFPEAASLGATLLAPGVSPIQGLVIETIMTFFLVNTIFNTAVVGSDVDGAGTDAAPLAIGFTLTFCILMGGPLTGGSLNPARTLGPAFASGNFADVWLYLVGPILGAVLAALFYNNVLKR